MGRGDWEEPRNGRLENENHGAGGAAGTSSVPSEDGLSGSFFIHEEPYPETLRATGSIRLRTQKVTSLLRVAGHARADYLVRRAAGPACPGKAR
jgi:hypothetical protein